MFVRPISNTSNTIIPRSFCLVALLVFIAPHLAAQEDDTLDTEVVNVVKPYSPTISDAFKVKESPLLNDSISSQKKEMQYGIFSVPVASTFTPAKGSATSVEKAKKTKAYDNYATLGLGNYTSVLGAFYSTVTLSKTDDVGMSFKHNSSLGSIAGARTQSDYLDSQLDLNYSSRQRNASYALNFGVQHQKYNWYGINDFFNFNPDSFFDDLDVSQHYVSATLGASIAMEDSFFESAAIHFRYLGDSYNSSEFTISALPKFSVPLNEYNLNIALAVDYISGSFFEDLFIAGAKKYTQFNVGVLPSISVVTDDLSLKLGVTAYLGMDGEANETDVYIYPNLSASYRLVGDLFIAYGGIEGGLMQNSFYGSKEVNPFVSPTLDMNPTSKTYDVFAGVKGKLTKSLAYNVRAGYTNEKDKALFKSNLYSNVLNTEGYSFGNSFGLVYDTVKTLGVFGELATVISKHLSIGVNATFSTYSTENQGEAWNLPTLQASMFSTFNITTSLYGGFSLFYVGERSDENSNLVLGAEDSLVTLEGYLDANVNVGCQITERLSVFVKGNNLLGDGYQKWYNYPVQGIQIMGGASYKFNWF
jgi:hypothetical protein